MAFMPFIDVAFQPYAISLPLFKQHFCLSETHWRGLSIRIFIVEEDDTIKRPPVARYERLLKRDPNEILPKYAGQRVRYALMVIDLVNRKPIEAVRAEYAY